MLSEVRTQSGYLEGASDAAGDVMAKLSYIVPGARTPFMYACEPPDGQPWEGAEFANVTRRVEDARHREDQPRLHVHGFELVDAPTAMRSFSDSDEIQAVYYDEVLEIALAATGGSYGFVFDHLVRRRDPSQEVLGFGRTLKGQAPSANGRIHNDYTEVSGQRRLRLVLGEGEPADSIHHFCIVNVWRSIAGPVLDAPLALCDSRTVAISDAVAAEVRFRERTGEIYLFRSSPWHRWYYYPHMQKGEAVVFKQYDSRVSSVSRFTPHSAFEHPGTPPGTPPRESIEARVLVVFE
jgi:hypothetical protein